MGLVRKRLAGPSAIANSVATKYTVPAATRTVLKHIHVSNTTAGAVTFTMSIGADAAGTRIYDAYSIAAGTVLDVWCYYILEATEIVQTNAGTNNILVITLDGDEWTL